MPFTPVAGGGTREATIVIAAHDARPMSRAMADMVCDGWNDEVEINSAIASLGMQGGSIQLTEGVFFIGTSIVINRDNVLLCGSGAGTVVRLQHALNVDIDMISSTDVVTLGTVVMNLVVDGRRDGQTAGIQRGINLRQEQDFIIQNVIVKNARNEGIRMSNPSLGRIDGCTVHDCGGDGIMLTLASSTIIDNCIVRRCGGVGIRVDGVQGVVSNNVSHSNTTDGINAQVSRSTLLGNVCENNGGNGISLFLTVTSTISSNICNTNSFSGIFTDNSNSNILNGNMVSNNNRHGIHLHLGNENVINSNVVRINSRGADNTWDNIHIDNGSFDTLVQGNILRSPALAPRVRHGVRVNDVLSERTMIINNDLRLSGFTSAISDAGTGTITVSGNKL